MLKKEVKQYLNSFKKLGFAISGGKDSMALLHWALNNLDKEKMLVVTINHNLRGEDGKRDKEFVEQYCLKNNIECIGIDIQVKEFAKEKGYTIEQAARILRQDIFKKLVEEKRVDRVVLAHHKDDQVESILMHIFRGSGLNGLIGMSKDNQVLLRPLIDVTQQEIEEYIKQHSIAFVQDSTNFELDYTRNKVRNVLIKEIEEIYPNFKENIIRLSSIASLATNYIKENAPSCTEKDGAVFVKIEDIKNRTILTDQTLINAIEMVHTRVNLEMNHIESIYDLINKENGKKLHLPFNTVCQKEYDCLVFFKERIRQNSPVALKKGELIFGDYKIIISNEANDGLRMDYSKIEGAVVRYRKEKDTFKKFKGGTKSLGDYLTDKKIPQRLKDFIPVIAKENQILAVLPYEIADSVKIEDNTKDVVYVLVKKTND